MSRFFDLNSFLISISASKKAVRRIYTEAGSVHVHGESLKIVLYLVQFCGKPTFFEAFQQFVGMRDKQGTKY